MFHNHLVSLEDQNHLNIWRMVNSQPHQKVGIDLQDVEPLLTEHLTEQEHPQNSPYMIPIQVDIVQLLSMHLVILDKTSMLES